MYVRTLKIEDFRNIEKVDLSFSEGLNILYGANAQGKSNTVESIKLCLSGNSTREKKRENFLPFDTAQCRIIAQVVSEDEIHNVEMLLTKEKKQCMIDDEPVRKRQELLRSFCVVLFTPDDVLLVKGTPSKRRDYMNEAISLLELKYYGLFIQYNKILKQRNALLRTSFDTSSQTLLSVYDEKISKVGASIIFYRLKFLKALNGIAQKRYQTLCAGKENFSLSYISNVLYSTDISDIASVYLQKLRDARNEDVRRKSTTVGIHHDDIGLFLNEKAVKNFASQGQMRSVALSLKLSVIDLYQEKFSEKPIVILDDVLSELDEQRKDLLLSSLCKHQTFITSANKADFKNAQNAHVFYVKNGVIKEYTDNAKQLKL